MQTPPQPIGAQQMAQILKGYYVTSTQNNSFLDKVRNA